jgi:hypothetical protein
MITLNDIKVEPYEDNEYSITLLSTDDVGIKYKYGKVSFDDAEDGSGEAIMNFDYDIISGTPRDLEVFHNTIGSVLQLMIENMIKDNSVVFAGGTD